MVHAQPTYYLVIKLADNTRRKINVYEVDVNYWIEFFESQNLKVLAVGNVGEISISLEQQFPGLRLIRD